MKSVIFRGLVFKFGQNAESKVDFFDIIFDNSLVNFKHITYPMNQYQNLWNFRQFAMHARPEATQVSAAACIHGCLQFGMSGVLHKKPFERFQTV